MSVAIVITCDCCNATFRAGSGLSSAARREAHAHGWASTPTIPGRRWQPVRDFCPACARKAFKEFLDGSTHQH
jgi:hypothetical protein